MGLVTALMLIVCGVLAASSAIVKSRPDSQKMIDKLVPYQGMIGLVVCLWGAWTIISALLNINLLHAIPIWWLTFLATGVVEFALGFLLGFALITKYALASSPEAMTKGTQLRAKLLPIQIPLGFVGIGLGVWCLAAVFIYHV